MTRGTEYASQILDPEKEEAPAPAKDVENDFFNDQQSSGRVTTSDVAPVPENLVTMNETALTGETPTKDSSTAADHMARYELHYAGKASVPAEQIKDANIAHSVFNNQQSFLNEATHHSSMDKMFG